MNYWIHRISHVAELSYPLLNKGYLTIGFSDFISEETIEKVRSEGQDYIDSIFQEKWGKKPKTRFSLLNFLKISKGDMVIVPTSGAFSVCEIVGEKPMVIGETYSSDLKTWGDKMVSRNGDFLCSENGNYDLGFAWKINIVQRDISRDKFADADLTSRMKIRQTNAKINDLRRNIEKCIENFISNKPIHLHSIIIDNTSSFVLDTIKKELNPDKFEMLIKTYFLSIGANDVYIPAKKEKNKEGDADIVAVFENIKLIIYTQAKFQKEQISEWATTQIDEYKSNKESIDDGYNKLAWVITTANTFNVKAENLAKERQIQLINGLEFSKMLLNVGINLLKTNL